MGHGENVQCSRLGTQVLNTRRTALRLHLASLRRGKNVRFLARRQIDSREICACYGLAALKIRYSTPREIRTKWQSVPNYSLQCPDRAPWIVASVARPALRSLALATHFGTEPKSSVITVATYVLTSKMPSNLSSYSFSCKRTGR